MDREKILDSKAICPKCNQSVYISNCVEDEFSFDDVVYDRLYNNLQSKCKFTCNKCKYETYDFKLYLDEKNSEIKILF